jgi:hypothetical protein
MKIDTNTLANLLRRTQRQQCVGDKPQSQVTSCLLQIDETTVSTTSLVRDGKTSLSKFVAPIIEHQDDDNAIPIPDIPRVLGVLSSHSSPLTIRTHPSKIVFKSGNKTTTLTASPEGLAFPHSQETILEWGSKSESLSERFAFDETHKNFVGYQMADGSIRKPMYEWCVDSNRMFEILRCDNMNGQKLNRYIISVDDAGITVSVGDELKGHTTDRIDIAQPEQKPFEWAFEGGLENVFSGMGGNCIIHFLDFREEKQGIRMLLDFGDCGFVYQAGVL